MALQFTSSDEAQCFKSKDSKSCSKHTSQLHIPLWSLPSPETPITIPSFPIEVRSETSVFNPKRIANLWTQLLSIHIQNGNFWKHWDAVELHREKAQAQSSRDAPANEMTSLEKGVLYLRHKLQKGLLSRDHLPIEAELPGLSRFLSKLESFGELPASILLTTKIHKVCKAVLKLENVPGDDIYQFKARFSALRDIYCKTLIQSEQQSGARTGDTPANPQTTLETPSKVEEVLDELPAMCLTQFTPEQCIHFQEVAAACDPPLDRGVVELMCMLPYFTSKYCVCDQQVVPGGRFEQPFHDSLEIDRLVYPGGPTIPPNMLKLTWWLSTNWGIALFVDTKTGEGIQMRDFRPEDKGVVCTEFEGYRRPIEELLQEWIDYYLEMKLVPSGREGILSEEFRSMDYLKHKSLLEEYGWPFTFPLLQPDYCSLIKRQEEIDKEIRDADDKIKCPSQKWNELTCQWHQINKTNFMDNTNVQEIERFKVLDRSVERAFLYHTKRIKEQQYSLAAGVPMDKEYLNLLTLSGAGHRGSDWFVEVTPATILERFNEVVGLISETDTDVKEMKAILDAGYERWDMVERGITPPDYVDEEDDDETSDFVPSEEEPSEDEEYETDEEDEDLDFDIVMLEEDIATDIEELRRRMEEHQIGGV